MESISKRFKSIAIGYACFTIMWIAVLGLILTIMGKHGFEILLDDPAFMISTMGSILIYIFVMILINGFMTISIWKTVSMSKKKKSFLVILSFIFASIYAVALILSILQGPAVQAPNWLIAHYGLIPSAMLTVPYAYFAFASLKAVKLSNQSLQPTTDSSSR